MHAIVGVLLTFFVVTAPVWAQTELVVSTGSETGTYHKFFQEITQVCTAPPLSERTSTGSLQNLDRLLGNQVNLAMVQADALIGRRHIDNDPEADNIRTLMVLYPEEVHIITRANHTHLYRFSDLGNKKVAAWGGSFITARVLFGKTGVRPFALRADLDSFPKALPALDKGEIDAILAVGGQPLEPVRMLSNQYKLVSFDRADQSISGIYLPAVLNYSNLGPGGIQTVATQSLLVTMSYRTPTKIRQLVELRRCIVQNIDTIIETTGSHPKWRLVRPDAKSVWPYYEPALRQESPQAPQRPKK